MRYYLEEKDHERNRGGGSVRPCFRCGWRVYLGPDKDASAKLAGDGRGVALQSGAGFARYSLE